MEKGGIGWRLKKGLTSGPTLTVAVMVTENRTAMAWIELKKKYNGNWTAMAWIEFKRNTMATGRQWRGLNLKKNTMACNRFYE